MSFYTSSICKTLFLGCDGKVLESLLLFPGSLNMGKEPYPWLPVVHLEQLNKEAHLIDLKPHLLDTCVVNLTPLGCHTAVNVGHWYQLYRLKQGPKKEWAFDWELKREYLIVTNSKGKDIQNHHLFNPETLLPLALASVTLFKHDYTSEQQLTQMVTLDNEQEQLPEGVLVYLVLLGWKLILIDAAQMHQVLLVKYHFQLVPVWGEGTVAQAYFHLGKDLCFIERYINASLGLPFSCMEAIEPKDREVMSKSNKECLGSKFWPSPMTEHCSLMFPWAIYPSSPALVTQLISKIEHKGIHEKQKERCPTPYPLTRASRAPLPSLSEESSSHSSMPEFKRIKGCLSILCFLPMDFFFMSKENAALIKAWVNMQPRGFEGLQGLIYQCLEFNIGF
ncbi:hypothetical protein EDD18DRAFT_1098017 [Armillaria luteobubalina]|uniref:Uncharacterized protein n=1 Tax=Armillaria luteobubalina TaxID=153913 RepID=A0AA39V135_9AGAR|nr:hypothetical protein EDD18DRAFT_1098017 [Armillaria luteobubalina]